MGAIGMQIIRAKTVTLSLLWECFWWLEMINQMQQSIKLCVQCLQHEGDLPKVPLDPIVATALLDFLHVDFTSIEMTMELNQPPRVANVLVFQDHFMKHLMAYVTLIRQLYQSPSSYIRVTSQSFGLQLGSWVIGVLSLLAASLTKHVCSWA